MEEENSRRAYQTEPESSQQDYEASVGFLFYLMLTTYYLRLALALCRELDRERGKLERQEKKIINDIKSMAKTGQMVRWYQ